MCNHFYTLNWSFNTVVEVESLQTLHLILKQLIKYYFSVIDRQRVVKKQEEVLAATEFCADNETVIIRIAVVNNTTQ